MSRRRRLAEVLTVGVPFAAFKLLVGFHVLAPAAAPPTAAWSATLWAAVGWGLVGLGTVDLALNGANALGLLAVGRPVAPLCLLHGVLRRAFTRRPSPGAPPMPAWEELGLALDTALAFVLVAAMIGLTRLPLLAPGHLAVWNVAVILNVLGAGVLRLAAAVRQVRPELQRQGT